MSEQPVVRCVGSDPEPRSSVSFDKRHCAVVESDPNRVNRLLLIHPLAVESWVRWVLLKVPIRGPGLTLHALRQIGECSPELRRCA